MATVFVTGGTGFVGSHVVATLRGAGHEVTRLVRDRHAARDEDVVGDLRDVATWQHELGGHDALVHLGLVWGDEDEERRLLDVEVSRALFERAARARVRRVVYASSTAVHRPFVATPMSEDDVLPREGEAADLYATTKLGSERALLAVAARTPSMSPTIVRLGPVLGAPHPSTSRHASDARIAAFVEAAKRGDEVTAAMGEGRQFVDVRDAAELVRRLVEGERAAPPILLAVAREPLLFSEIAARVLAHCARTGAPVLTPSRADVPLPRFDTTRLEAWWGGALTLDDGDALDAHLETLLAGTR